MTTWCLTCCGLRPLCLLGVGPHSWATVLHKRKILRSWTTMTSASIHRSSWRDWCHFEFESSFTLIFMMWTYPRKRRWTSTFPLSSVPLVGVLWWDFGQAHYWSRGSNRSSTRWRDRDALRRCCVPPSTHKMTSSTTSSVTMTSNLMPKSCKDLNLGEWPGCSGMSGCSVCPIPHFYSHFITCFVVHIIFIHGMHPSSNYLLVVKKKCLNLSNKTLPQDMVRLYILLCLRLVATTCAWLLFL
jgi:hypothetical protein